MYNIYMQDEIEVKFIRQDHAIIRQKLKSVNATMLSPERKMIRVNYDFPDGRLADGFGWVRVRDEGDVITLSYKQSNDAHIRGMQEVNIKIDSFDMAVQFLHAVGITKRKALQETKRETWHLDGVTVELDTWPWIPTFVELEGPTEIAVVKAASKLGFDMKNALFGSVIPAYKAEYNISGEEISHWPEYKFGPVPQFFQDRKK
jgi:adenylate cyclase class 2